MRKILFILIWLPFFGNSVITPTYTCGMECGVNNSSAHTAFTGSAAFETSIVRSGARSVRRPAGVSSSSYSSFANIGDAGSGFIHVYRFYIYFSSLPTANCSVMTDALLSPYPALMYKTSDNSLYAGFASGVLFGGTGVAITTGVWYRIDIKADKTNNPWTCDVKVDGVSCGQATSAQGASSGLIFPAFGNLITSTNFDACYDDLIVSVTGGDYPIGAGYVNHFVPTSDGTHSGLTASDFQRTLTGTDIINSTTTAYQLLDDVPLESGSSVDWINMSAPVASTYVENVFGPAPGISTPTVAPRMVSAIIGIHAFSTNPYNGEWLLNDNGTTASIFTASAAAGSTTIIYKTLNLADPPSAATVWTLSGNGNFNNVRVRFGPTGTVDANPDVYFDCAMIEAEFETINNTIPGTPSDKRHTTLGVGGYALLSPHSKQIIQQTKQLLK